MELKDLEAALFHRTGEAEFQYVTVTFTAANTDTDIKHTLLSYAPQNVRYLVVDWALNAVPATPPVIYRDTSPGARKWGTNYIILRCTVAAVTARLRLFLEP